jgi:enoyl-[acyl-carrier protein] reductase I
MAKRALIIGVANERSLAWGIAQSLHKQGFELAFTYVNDKMESRVRPLAESLNSPFIYPCDVSSDQEIEKLFSELSKKWDSLDAVVHSVAFANKEDLEGRFMDTSRDGFKLAMDISAYSLVACAKHAHKLMKSGGSIITLSYLGAQRVVPNYNVMGVAKAALEACVRYLAYDVGPDKIRVNAISAGPVKTLAAAGIRDFRSMLKSAEEKVPLKENITQESVGDLGAFLCSDGSRHITGEVIYVDSGYHMMS